MMPAEAAYGRHRRAWVLSLLVASLWGCGEDTRNMDKNSTLSTDLVALKRLIKLPAGVASAEWQTGKLAPHGGDWWLAAVLDVPADQMSSFLTGQAGQDVFETPPGMQFSASFAALKSLPGAQSSPPSGFRLIADIHSIEAYASSPLLNGKAMRLSGTQVLVVLWTN